MKHFFRATTALTAIAQCERNLERGKYNGYIFVRWNEKAKRYNYYAIAKDLYNAITFAISKNTALDLIIMYQFKNCI